MYEQLPLADIGPREPEDFRLTHPAGQHEGVERIERISTRTRRRPSREGQRSGQSGKIAQTVLMT